MNVELRKTIRSKTDQPVAMELRACGYFRVSTGRQAESDLSIPDQRKQVLAHCAARGWKLVAEYIDAGASGMEEDRAQFQKTIERASDDDRPFEIIIVHSFSRFFRDAFGLEMYVRRLAKHGVRLVSITQELGDDPAQVMMRPIIALFDEYQSRENSKHVLQAMKENARQGFYNGSPLPLGYATRVAERRGNKDKKVLVVDEDEARVVRMIFDFAAGVNGRSLGVKNIAVWLNERGYTRRGVPFSTGSIHDILHTSTYYGVHHFNKRDSRTFQPHPPSEWVKMEAPALLSEDTFNAVQGLLQSRRPTRVPPRVVTSPTLLAGVVRCGYCGAAMIQNTGKGGQYKYYCCSKKLKEGRLSCTGIRMPMDKLDDIVIGEVANRVLEPTHLTEMLQAFIKASAEREGEAKERLNRLRHTHTDAKAGITNLLQLAEKGLMDAEDPEMRERLVALKIKRDETAKEIADLQKQMASAEPVITPEKIARVARLLSDKLYSGPADFRQAYARLLLDEVIVTHEEIRISGSKAVLARAATHDADIPAPAVLSFVQEWRARRDSNS